MDNIQGLVEEILPGRVRGWAFDADRPNLPISVSLRIDGVEVAVADADYPRRDLAAAKKGDGAHAFRVVSGAVDPARQIEVYAGASPNPLPILWNARTEVVRSIADLDARIARLAAFSPGSIEHFNECASFHYYEDIAGLPNDPLSLEYKKSQIDLYLSITSKLAYNPWLAEPLKINAEISADPRPYPFSTGNPDCIGCHLVALGHILLVIADLRMSEGVTILEYGCGTGFTTIHLAASGYHVTAVDINADALAVVDKLAATRRLQITTFNGEFGQVPAGTVKQDIILFYEAFHHCIDFTDLLRTLHDRLKPNGAIIFAGEPIFDDFPKPWGLRLDGHAVSAIRTIEWLELGFNERFFVDLLESVGFAVTKRSFDIGPPIFSARKA